VVWGFRVIGFADKKKPTAQASVKIENITSTLQTPTREFS
jgi:hypothetical protein